MPSASTLKKRELRAARWLTPEGRAAIAAENERTRARRAALRELDPAPVHRIPPSPSRLSRMVRAYAAFEDGRAEGPLSDIVARFGFDSPQGFLQVIREMRP